MQEKFNKHVRTIRIRLRGLLKTELRNNAIE